MQFISDVTQVLRAASWEKAVEALNAPAGSPFALVIEPKLWNWQQILDPLNFEFVPRETPLSDFGTVVYVLIGYWVTILGLKLYMSNRPAYKIKNFTALHNLFLCGLSALMFAAGLYGAYERVQQRGIDEIFCTVDPKSDKGILTWALYIYYLSKFPELIDTVILVLKKKPVIFLHWYHHSIVIVMVYVWLHYQSMFGTHGMLLNTLVHVFMYWYYFASLMGWNVSYKKYLTSGQILQFTTFLPLSVYYYHVYTKTNCVGFPSWVFSMGVNLTFLYLFIDFYTKAYTKPSKKVQQSNQYKQKEE
ncbi:GNS1/SUR4 family-domain-containing protein [Gorgonomyces haynaldii]|nr:GNS1/SUR4 family-domain-containing protein [Gorgonomyces haynaldii]